MANIAGYRAVIEAAHVFGRFFTGQVTAAGKVPPAKVLVAGAGVAGLAAIGAAGGLGAIVRATDPRPEVADQVKSLGGEYLAVESRRGRGLAPTGYAKEMGDDYNAREPPSSTPSRPPDVDIIITTALIPGRPAPRLITAEMVASMKPGSVIVDMAAANGGNVEGSVAGEVVVTANGVTIIGYTDLAGRLPAQASQLYGTNLVNLMKLLTPGQGRRSSSSTSTTSCSAPITVVARRRADLAAAAGAGVGGARRRGAAPRRSRASRRRRRCRRRAGSRIVGVGALLLLPARRASRRRAAAAPHGVRAGDRDRLLRDRQRAPRAAHAADVGDQRDLRASSSSARCCRSATATPSITVAGVRRDPARQHQRLRRLRRHPPHARDVLGRS